MNTQSNVIPIKSAIYNRRRCAPRATSVEDAASVIEQLSSAQVLDMGVFSIVFGERADGHIVAVVTGMNGAAAVIGPAELQAN